VILEDSSEGGLLLRLVARGHHVIAKVLAVEPRDDRFGIVQPELPRDVLADVRRGRRRERDRLRPADALAEGL
jgi:hypothetical protein